MRSWCSTAARRRCSGGGRCGGGRQVLAASAVHHLPAAQIGRVVSLQTLDLRDNDLAELPPELTELVRLRDLRLEGNAQMQTSPSPVARACRRLRLPARPARRPAARVHAQSAAGGASMSKTSVKNWKPARGASAGGRRHGAPIGLEIARQMLPDSRGRARRGMFVVYDVGGHDEYQEMRQVFVTPNTLYLLLWNVAKQPAEGQDVRLERERVAQQVRWARSSSRARRLDGAFVQCFPCFHTLSFAVLFRLCAVLGAVVLPLVRVLLPVLLPISASSKLHAVESSFLVLCYLSRSLRVTVLPVLATRACMFSATDAV